ncbi:hypothetical protein AK812_SmicGene18214 [Symbiodinium microadriaticum]|uniref:Uncharacterized protein n=1 Tax=Symbiodinium microadriaticum TaxID=2951 RepID=A0A1Q9DVQ3_SYMMI|nr:hypothetical protein AK812_SmicGene18214 [Symbiodinium microadriaticum]
MYIAARACASSPLRTPDAIQQNSRSSLLIQEMQNEEGDLQQQILAQGCRSNDPEDRGYEPSTVPRGHCQPDGFSALAVLVP